MRFRMFMLAVSSAAAIAAGAPPVSAQTQGEEITSTVIPLDRRRPPSDELALKACKYIANLPVPERMSKLIQSGYFDANNDNVKEDVSYTLRGTMRIEDFEIKSMDGKPISIGPDDFEWKEIGSADFEWKDFMTFGSAWLKFEGYTFKVNFDDHERRAPIFISIVTPNNIERIVCKFQNVRRWRMYATKPEYEPVCRAAKNGKMSESAAHVPPPDALKDIENLDERLHSRWSTYPIASSSVDFDNDGAPEILVNLGFASSAARGCETNYFDIVDEEGRILENSKKRALLMKMQSVEMGRSVPWPNNCGSKTNFARYQNKTYFETKPMDKNKNYYSLRLVENGGWYLICGTRSSLTTTVTR